MIDLALIQKVFKMPLDSGDLIITPERTDQAYNDTTRKYNGGGYWFSVYVNTPQNAAPDRDTGYKHTLVCAFGASDDDGTAPVIQKIAAHLTWQLASARQDTNILLQERSK